MLYITLNKKNEITGLATEDTKGAVPADLTDPTVIAFLQGQGLTPESLTETELKKSDIPLIRVIEDLVDVLIMKGMLNLTDLPPSAIQKLSLRSRVREERKNLRGLVDEGGQEILL